MSMLHYYTTPVEMILWKPRLMRWCEVQKKLKLFTYNQRNLYRMCDPETETIKGVRCKTYFVHDSADHKLGWILCTDTSVDWDAWVKSRSKCR